MTLDVALRLRLENQLSAGAKAAEKDLSKVADAAKKLNGTKGGAQFAADLEKIDKAATRSGHSIERVGKSRNRLAATAQGARDLTRQMEGVDRAAGRSARSLDRIRDARGRFVSAAGGARELARQLDRVDRSARNAGRSFDRLRDTRGRAGGSALHPEKQAHAPRGAVGGGMGVAPAAAIGAAAMRYASPFIGGVAVAGVTKKAFVDYANFDRTMRRIGITAEATGAEVSAATSKVKDLAKETRLPLDDVVQGLDALATQGKSMPESMAMLPAIARTAQAAGADVSDIANTAGAVADSLKISGAEMQNAFDIMVAGGKAGKFELKDMSRYLPSLAPAFAAVGDKGETGLRKLVATLQIIRNQTGTAEEAAASAQNIFSKMESQETAARFKKFGVDLRKEMAKARKSGADLLETFINLSEKAIKGDLSKIPQLFSDMELARGMRAVISQHKALIDLDNQLGNARGSTAKDYQTVIGDTRASVDALTASWNSFLIAAGKTVAPAIVPVLQAVTKTLDDVEKGETTFQRLLDRHVAYQKELAQLKGQITPDGKIDMGAPVLDDIGGDNYFDREMPWLGGAYWWKNFEEWLGRNSAESKQKGIDAARVEKRAEDDRILSVEDHLRVRVKEAEEKKSGRLGVLRRELAKAEERSLPIRVERLNAQRMGMNIPVTAPQPITPGATTFGDPTLGYNSRRVGWDDEDTSPSSAPDNPPLPPSRPVGLGNGASDKTLPTLQRIEDVLGNVTDAAQKFGNTLGQDLSGAARQSMSGYNSAMQAEVQQAEAIVLAAAQRMQAALSFTAAPTISPRVSAPGPSAAVPPPASPEKTARASSGLVIQQAHFHGVKDVPGMHR
ncbi:MAG: phage tail tape measure protein, partial [Parvibaculum sp.]|nr:phage tail tape measure protein [Parvibaculum sp.]